MTPIISEYQNGTRNARVYKTTSGQYGVLLFDANDDYNEFQPDQNDYYILSGVKIYPYESRIILYFMSFLL